MHLHGDLAEEVYMRLPPGFKASSPHKVCRLRKSLYGLKQAPRNWFAKLASALRAYGFVQSVADYSLSTLHRNGRTLCVLVYVDDLLIGGSKSGQICALKQYLSTCFHMKDLGTLKYFLGIEVARDTEGIHLCQRKYALDIIANVGLLAAKPAKFPMEPNHKLSLATGPLLEHPEAYRRLIDRLVYLTITRPDLSYYVHCLAQYMQNPRLEYWEAALRVVRYIKNNPGQGIFLSSRSALHLSGSCDSD